MYSKPRHKLMALLMVGTGLVVARPALGQTATAPSDLPARCATLAAQGAMAWPDPTTRVTAAVWREAGPLQLPSPPGMPPQATVDLPAHCEVTATMRPRTGSDGQAYAIRFHVRLPADWNGRFFMQGGGGSNGDLGDAIGRLSGGARPALAQGFAVMSQDSGHDNAVNTVPERNGASAFGFDPQARADYGGTSLPPTVNAAKALIKTVYGKAPVKSYFVGCSKGGQEGMMAAQRYPDLFDGIVAAAPGFALPRAALTEAWDTQALARIVAANGQALSAQSLSQTFSPSDFALLGKAILAACDSEDGVADGMIAAFGRCTSAKVLPQLARVTCSAAKADGCLSAAQVLALRQIHDGAHDGRGRLLYAGFPWDAGWADMGWRIWKIGGGPIPSINLMMGAPSLAAAFTVPPTAIGPGPDAGLAYMMAFDFNRDPAKLEATDANFPRSPWTDIGAQSTDLSAFRARGGKLIVPHGVSDPVFSLDDTLAWYGRVDKAMDGHAGDTVRVFAVPGMNHCQGGPATDSYDAFAALADWVEHRAAPERIVAKAGPMTPWPGRTRPLCAFPKAAHYDGHGDVEKAESFSCQ